MYISAETRVCYITGRQVANWHRLQSMVYSMVILSAIITGIYGPIPWMPTMDCFMPIPITFSLVKQMIAWIIRPNMAIG
ncbi:hypothetical protein D3C80_1482410 [compost metagenome]